MPQPCHNRRVPPLFRRPLRSGPIPALGAALLVLALSVISPTAGASAKTRAFNANGQGNLLIIGDSLTLGADAFGSLATKIRKTKKWTSVSIDTRVGRKASVGADMLPDKILNHTTAIVIALGTNDMMSRTESWYPRWVIDRVMANTLDIPVLWVNLKFSNDRLNWKSRANRFNRALRQAKLRYPTLTIADWNTSFIPKSGSRFIADGVHLTVSGYRTRAKFLIPTIAKFGTAVVNATSTTTSTTTTSEPPTTTTIVAT
jgi:lysophospholipase L1-like esterase